MKQLPHSDDFAGVGVLIYMWNIKEKNRNTI